MAMYMAMGCLLFRSGKITLEGSKSIASILLWLVIPAVILDSFCTDCTAHKLQQFLISALMGGGALLISILIARFSFPNSPVDNFSAAFSNAGFMGIPLVRACFGDNAVFFLVGFVALLNLLQWTYGASVLSRRKARMGLRQILLNPIFISLITGILLFVTGLGARLPDILRNTVKGVSALNGPVAMIILGVYLGRTEPGTMFANKKLLGMSVLRLLVIPAVTLVAMLPIPVDVTIKLTILTAACAPVGSNVAVYAQLYGQNENYACRSVALTTLLSIVTMPVVLAAGSTLFG